jgi:hypothetical protein
MKALKLIIYIVLAFYGLNAVPMNMRHYANSLSLLDLHEKGLYFGLAVNNSSHFVELEIFSLKDKNKVFLTIMLPPQRASIKKDFNRPGLLNKTDNAGSLPNIKPLWLKIGYYKVSIRNRDDLANNGPPGSPKIFNLIIEKDYVEKLPGPFTLEIDED